MKISDITQRSQVQHIAEGRKQLDEALPAVAAGGALALWLAAQGLTIADYYRLAQKNGTEGDPSYDPTDWDTESQMEFGITGAAGLAGGWFGKMVAKPLGWAVGGTMKLASPFFNKVVKQASRQVKDAKNRVQQAKANPGDVVNGKVIGVDGKPTTIKPTDLAGRNNIKNKANNPTYRQNRRDQINKAKEDLKIARANRANARAKVGSSTSTGIMRTGRIVGGLGTGAYALDKMGKSVGDLITGKGYEPMTDAEKKARDAANKARELKRKLRFSGPSSHRSGVGVIGQDQYDITSQKIKQWEKEKENLVQLEKEAAEAAAVAKAEKDAAAAKAEEAAAKAEKAAAAAKAEKQANQQDQSQEK